MKTIACAIAAIGLVATPALAGVDKAPTTIVEYADLNLSSVEGQKALDSRIDSAARKLCQVDRIRTGTRLISADAKACYAKARASAKQQVASVVADHQLGG